MYEHCKIIYTEIVDSIQYFREEEFTSLDEAIKRSWEIINNTPWDVIICVCIYKDSVFVDEAWICEYDLNLNLRCEIYTFDKRSPDEIRYISPLSVLSASRGGVRQDLGIAILKDDGTIFTVVYPFLN